MVLDKVAGDQAAGAVADEDDFLVTQPPQFGDVFPQAAALDHLLKGDILTVGEGVDVGLRRQFLDETTAGTLPVAEAGLRHAGRTEVHDEAVDQHDGEGLPLRAGRRLVDAVGRHLHEARLHRGDLENQGGQQGGENGRHHCLLGFLVARRWL